MKKVYVIGSLHNEVVPKVAAELRRCLPGIEVFDDWYAAGPEADDYWQRYEKSREHDYVTALRGYAANNTYQYDKRHLDEADAAVLVLPGGKSAHLELGYMVGRGKAAYILLEQDAEPRWDVMYLFATQVCRNMRELWRALADKAVAESESM